MLEVGNCFVSLFFFDGGEKFFDLGHLIGKELIEVISLRDEVVVFQKFCELGVADE